MDYRPKFATSLCSYCMAFSRSHSPAMGSQEALQNDRYRAFVERLVEARKEAGLSQEQAAEAMGRPQYFVSRCETGERRVDAVEFLDFCMAYGLSPSWFLEGWP